MTRVGHWPRTAWWRLALLRTLPVLLVWAATVTLIHPLSHLPGAHAHAAGFESAESHTLDSEPGHAADRLCLECLAAEAARVALPSAGTPFLIAVGALPAPVRVVPADPGRPTATPRSRSPPLA